MDSEIQDKRRKVDEGPGWVFVSNLPPPSSFPLTLDYFKQWFDAAMRDRITEQDKQNRVAGGLAEITSTEKFVLTIDQFSPNEGVCYLKLKYAREVFIALRVSGCSFKGHQISVTLVQCLPDPSLMVFPVISDECPPSPLPFLESWRGKYIVFSEVPPNTPEADIRSLFEALGGPLQSLWTYKVSGLFKGCGRLALVNSLINESVVQRLNGASVGSSVMRIASLIPDNRPRPNMIGGVTFLMDELAPANEVPVLSVSAQLMSDPVIAVQMRSGRQMGERPSRVVQLLNIVRLEDLLCAELHEELIQDVSKEASKFGKLEKVIAPQPLRKGYIDPSSGCGKIFLEFTDTTAARKAQLEMNGRIFDNRVVCASFYPLMAYQLKQYSLLVP